MNRMSKLALVMVLVAVVSFLVAGMSFMEYGFELPFNEFFSEEDRYDVFERRTLALDRVDDLVIEGVSEEIYIRYEEVEELIVELSGEVYTTKGSNQPYLEIEEGSQLSIGVSYPRKWISSFTADLSLTITLPMDFSPESLKVKAVSGNLRGESLQGDRLVLETVSGNINFNDLMTTALRAQSTSGEITLAGSFEEGRIKSVSGDLDIDLSDQMESLSLETTSGNVTLEVNDVRDLRIEGDSVSGEFTVSFGLDELTSKDHSIEGVNGKGSRTITIDTISGDVKLHE